MVQRIKLSKKIQLRKPFDTLWIISIQIPDLNRPKVSFGSILYFNSKLFQSNTHIIIKSETSDTAYNDEQHLILTLHSLDAYQAWERINRPSLEGFQSRPRSPSLQHHRTEKNERLDRVPKRNDRNTRTESPGAWENEWRTSSRYWEIWCTRRTP